MSNKSKDSTVATMTLGPKTQAMLEELRLGIAKGVNLPISSSSILSAVVWEGLNVYKSKLSLKAELPKSVRE